MSGHNKWSKIKHKKASSDAQKSKIFSKYAKMIDVEAKKAGGDVNSPGLKAVIDSAKKDNMPNENIDRAIKKATDPNTAAMEEVVYEAYGPGGVAIIITALTDNRNRTAAEIKHLLSKNGLSLAEPGAASWAFAKEEGEYMPNTTIDLSEEDEEKLEEIIDSLNESEEIEEVFTNRS
ncbi:MAG: YebC/PmpR family DNA-binding transcriptional regulator [Candidatus Campbellbacteria bacterium]|nr:YebC/PmpR family DNA-binding transcriptional regulator [Candidatus Campbellbacteria bacterium]